MNKRRDENPFKGHILYYYYLAFEVLKGGKYKRILDIGCGEGNFISRLKSYVPELYGYDVDKHKIQRAKRKWPFIKFSDGGVRESLPYRSNYFDAICLFHVLEHVDSEERIIKEAHRVLKPNGIILIASPYKGLFTWADTANLRYTHPYLHKLLGRIYFGRKLYEEKFVLQKENSMFGDSTITRKEHTHYKENTIRNLLNKKFEILEFDKFSLFLPFWYTLYNLWEYFGGQDKRIAKWLIWKDHHLKAGELSYNMFIIAKKCSKK